MIWYIISNNKESKERLSNLCFTQLLPYTNNMIEFYLDDRIIVKIVDEFVEKYSVQQEVANSIYELINPNLDIIDSFREQYINNPSIIELKEDILGAAKIVIDK